MFYKGTNTDLLKFLCLLSFFREMSRDYDYVEKPKITSNRVEKPKITSNSVGAVYLRVWLNITNVFIRKHIPGFINTIRGALDKNIKYNSWTFHMYIMYYYYKMTLINIEIPCHCKSYTV